VRFEGNEKWSFKHGPSIVEVETMGEVVADIEGNAGQRDIFMQSMKMK
jgi:hypothetical protein